MKTKEDLKEELYLQDEDTVKVACVIYEIMTEALYDSIVAAINTAGIIGVCAIIPKIFSAFDEDKQ